MVCRHASDDGLLVVTSGHQAIYFYLFLSLFICFLPVFYLFYLLLSVLACFYLCLCFICYIYFYLCLYLSVLSVFTCFFFCFRKVLYVSHYFTCFACFYLFYLFSSVFICFHLFLSVSRSNKPHDQPKVLTSVTSFQLKLCVSFVKTKCIYKSWSGHLVTLGLGGVKVCSAHDQVMEAAPLVYTSTQTKLPLSQTIPGFIHLRTMGSHKNHGIGDP